LETYLVGGAVRDRRLGLEENERDWVVVGATPEQMLERGFRQVGKDFPVFLHPDTGEEYALARTERKTAPGYKGFAVHAARDVTLEEDLKRRDLTINAMAETEQGELIDPFGGAADLDRGLLRHVSPAFAEDPVRILRVARFAARFAGYGFKVAHGTNALMRGMVETGEVDHLVPERVWAELEKALHTDHPHRFFEVLRGCGALAVLFPEIDARYPKGEAHGEKTGHPALAMLARAAHETTDARVRFAALLLALAPEASILERIELAEDICNRFRVPNDYRELALHGIGLEARAGSTQAARILELLEIGGAYRHPGRWCLLLDVYQACGCIDTGHRELLESLRAATAAVSAADVDVQRLRGPAVGRAISDKRLEIIEQALQAE
jgi:tRNA nucleotidyltransferase (CCA-adding enzyme)